MRRALIGFAALLALGTLGFAALAWRPAIDAVTPPAHASFDLAEIARGAEFALIGNCSSCHTRADGEPYAGGLGVRTPFGTIYASNITPEPDTGIGRWSEAAFIRSMREGVGREGRHLYPAFP